MDKFKPLPNQAKDAVEFNTDFLNDLVKEQLTEVIQKAYDRFKESMEQYLLDELKAQGFDLNEEQFRNEFLTERINKLSQRAFNKIQIK